LRGGRAVDERGWSGFGRVGCVHIYREPPRCTGSFGEAEEE
jgi:hypothetical protein